MRFYDVTLAVISILMFLVTPCHAGVNDHAAIALHDQPRASKQINVCPSGPDPQDPVSAGIPCSNFSVDNRPVGSSRDVYLVVGRADEFAGVAGLSCGIRLVDNTATFGWTLCADGEAPNGGWPDHGGGNRIIWDPVANCQTTAFGEPGYSEGAHAVAGAFYVYSYGDGRIEVTSNNGTAVPELAVYDCSGVESEIYRAGAVGYGSRYGEDACLQTPPFCIDDDGNHIGTIICCCDGQGGTITVPQGNPSVSVAECQAAGGFPSYEECGVNCAHLCAPVAVHATSWGRIKARHDQR